MQTDFRLISIHIESVLEREENRVSENNNNNKKKSNTAFGLGIVYSLTTADEQLGITLFNLLSVQAAGVLSIYR